MRPPIDETLFIMNHGHCASEPLRSEFINQVLSFADLESYPRRADFEKAFSPEGTIDDRQREAKALAEAKPLAEAAYLLMDDYKFAQKMALKKFPWPVSKSEFVTTFLLYGGGRYGVVTEQQRLAFCNWLLMECMQKFPSRDDFVRHFSAGGAMVERLRIAALLESDGCVAMGDIVDAVFQCAMNTDFLATHHAGENGVR